MKTFFIAWPTKKMISTSYMLFKLLKL